MQQNRTGAGGSGGADLSAVTSFIGQLMTLPFSMMMYGLDFLIRSMANMPGLTMPMPGQPGLPAPAPGQQGVPAMPAPSGAPSGAGMPGAAAGAAAMPPVAPPAGAPPGWSVFRPPRPAGPEAPPGPGQSGAAHAGGRRDETHSHGTHDSENPKQEQARMMDKNLNDDMLKTVRYWIAFEKRDYETVLYQGTDQVFDNLTAAQFTAWKMAEFMQQLKDGDIKVPVGWKNKSSLYIARKKDDGTTDKTRIGDFHEEDKKYLTVDWEVVGRVQRRKGYFDERKTEALERIADCCEELPGKPNTKINIVLKGSSAGTEPDKTT
jgi:hypothetical protein